MEAMRKGLGATNVEAIAKALLGGQLHPTFETTYYQPPYLPTGQETQAPSWMYMDPAGAGQIASLLGGSVFQSPPPNLPGAPAANWIRLGDGGHIARGIFSSRGRCCRSGTCARLKTTSQTRYRAGNWGRPVREHPML